MFFLDQDGGVACGICRSPGTNKSTCPCNPDVKKPNFEKHPRWEEFCPNAKGTPTQPKVSPPKPQVSPPKPKVSGPCAVEDYVSGFVDYPAPKIYKSPKLKTTIYKPVSPPKAKVSPPKAKSATKRQPQLENLIYKCYETGECDDNIWIDRWMAMTGEQLEMIPGFNAMESYIINVDKNLDNLKYEDSDLYRDADVLDLVFSYGMENLVKNYFEPLLLKNIGDSTITRAFLNGHIGLIKYMKQLGRQMGQHTFGNNLNIIAGNGQLDMLKYIKSVPEFAKLLTQYNPETYNNDPVFNIKEIVIWKNNEQSYKSTKLFAKPIKHVIEWLVANNLMQPITKEDIKYVMEKDPEVYAALVSTQTKVSPPKTKVSPPKAKVSPPKAKVSPPS
jgi:hypothetical protein